MSGVKVGGSLAHGKRVVDKLTKNQHGISGLKGVVEMWGKIVVGMAVVFAGVLYAGSCWLQLEASKRKNKARKLYRRTKGLTNVDKQDGGIHVIQEPKEPGEVEVALKSDDRI